MAYNYGAMVGMILTGENQSTRRKTCTSVVCATQIPHGLAWDMTRNFFVGAGHLTALTIATNNVWSSVSSSSYFLVSWWREQREPYLYPKDRKHQCNSESPFGVMASYFSVYYYTGNSHRWNIGKFEIINGTFWKHVQRNNRCVLTSYCE